MPPRATWDAAPPDGDFSHYVERLNQQQAKGVPQPAPAVTLEQVAQVQNVLRLVYVFVGAILLTPVAVSLWHAWQALQEAGPLIALLIVVTGSIIPLIMFVFIFRVLRQRAPDTLAKMLERNSPHAPPEP